MKEIKRKSNPDELVKAMDTEEVINHFYLLIVNSEIPNFLAQSEFIQNYSFIKSNSTNEYGFVIANFCSAVEMLRREITTKKNLQAVTVELQNNYRETIVVEEPRVKSNTIISLADKMTKKLWEKVKK